MRIVQQFICGVSILMLLSTAGCIPLLVGAAAGAGGIIFVKGNLERNFDESVNDLYDASLKAMKTLDVFISRDELNRHSAKIKGEFIDGQPLTVSIEALTERSSKLKIRVGMVGDEERSHLILKYIEKNL